MQLAIKLNASILQRISYSITGPLECNNQHTHLTSTQQQMLSDDGMLTQKEINPQIKLHYYIQTKLTITNTRTMGYFT